MKRYIKSNSYEDTRYNISWYSQDGSQNGENVLVPAEEMYDPYSYIEHYLINTYGDEYGGIADYIECCDSVKAMTEDDDDDEWNPYSGGTYRIDGRFIKYSDVPVTAITTWFKMQKDAWSDVCIMCRYRKDAIKLLEQATPELLEELNERYEQPYKLDYLIDEVRKQLDNGCRSFYENDYGYGDQIHPFSVG